MNPPVQTAPTGAIPVGKNRVPLMEGTSINLRTSDLTPQDQAEIIGGRLTRKDTPGGGVVITHVRRPAPSVAPPRTKTL